MTLPKALRRPFTRSERRFLRPSINDFTRPMLVYALEQVQSVCPPRVTRQSKAHLVACVNRALHQDDNNPTRKRMQDALAEARRKF